VGYGERNSGREEKISVEEGQNTRLLFNTPTILKYLLLDSLILTRQ
jgi:hypothetical protein